MQKEENHTKAYLNLEDTVEKPMHKKDLWFVPVEKRKLRYWPPSIS